jgi:diguanylate cyclase (GGDEF)-like protein
VLWADRTARDLLFGGAAPPAGAAPWAHAAARQRTECEALWAAARNDGTGLIVEFPVPAGDGETIRVRLVLSRTQGRTDALNLIGTVSEVSADDRQRTFADQLLGIVDAAGEAVVMFDRAHRVTFANETARRLLGITVEGDATPVSAETKAYVQAVRDQVPRGLLDAHDPRDPVTRWEGEVGLRAGEEPRVFKVVAQAVRDRGGSLEHWSTIATDVTEDRRAVAAMQRSATHDALTGLANRSLLLSRCAQALERAAAGGRSVALLFIDLDRLKHVNDTIGHAAGDHYILGTARRLAAATRPSDLVARISGDEFAVLCEGVIDDDIALEIAERVRTSITGSFTVLGAEIDAGASIGVAISDADLLASESPDEAAVTLLRRADTAMYRAKQKGRGRSEIYSDDMHRAARERLELAADLERALAAGQLRILYQPVMSAHSGRITGIEALLRWEHPERGDVAPTTFIELAEESGLIAPIGDWAAEVAAGDLASLVADGIVDDSCALHLNASGRQLADSSFVERLVGLCRGTGLAPQRMVIETSEANLVDTNPSVLRTVSALSRHGIRIAVDDFGSGWSSLNSLRQFPADILKLDGSLVRDLGRDDQGDDPIVRSLIQLAHSLDLIVIAEWVTTDDQARRLRALGCDRLQGNHLCPPLDIDALRSRHSSAGSGPVPAK